MTIKRTPRPIPIAAALLLAGSALFAGCSDDGAAQAKDDPTSASPSASSSALTSTSPSGTPSTSPSPSKPGKPTKPGSIDDWVITPGAVGEARVGMTRAEWTPTGLFSDGPVLCGELIHWTQDPTGQKLFVLTDRDATLTQINIGTPGPHTERGNIEVGSTYGELKAAWGDDLTQPEPDGWDYASVQGVDDDDETSIAFLLKEAPGEVTDATEIATISVSGATKPYLQYDC